MQLLKCSVAVLLAAPIFGSGGAPESKNLTVHEWGTFTTVAGEDGSPAPWEPLGGPSDLPCFVVHLQGRMVKSIAGTMTNTALPTPATKIVTVRMETPVLYFYAPQKTKVSVGVDFPHGLITEWYPRASKVSPDLISAMPAIENGRIEWDPIEITPGAKPEFPKGVGASPYYAARETDSDPVRTNYDQEKLLFYRGIANFPVPVNARVTSDGSVELSNTGDEALSLAVLFENRGGRVGYRVMRNFRGRTEVTEPELTGNLANIKANLAEALTAQGLYRKEADAMLATWGESWFEEGMRVFYVVPRKLVDRELPLTIVPGPKAIERVFVGRVEMLSPSRHDRLATALVNGNTTELDRFGRFLKPFMEQVKVTPVPAVAGYLAAKSSQARQEFFSPSCVK